MVGKIGVALPPVSEGVMEAAEKGEGYIGYYDGGAFGLPVTSKNQDPTLLFMQFLAEEEIQRHADEAIKRWPITALTIIHRVGRLVPGDNIVLVLTASAHRQAAFAAAEFLMDYLKAHAPFWKREERADGSAWVEAHQHDDAAAARWEKQ